MRELDQRERERGGRILRWTLDKKQPDEAWQGCGFSLQGKEGKSKGGQMEEEEEEEEDIGNYHHCDRVRMIRKALES